MIRSLYLRQSRLAIPSRSTINLSQVSRPTRCVPLKASSLEFSPWLARTASSSPKPTPQSTTKAAPESVTSKLKGAANPRLIIYHAGMPRIMFLGALKITTVFVFGFFAVVTIPTYIQADAPIWQTAGLFVASVVPLLAVWYMTSPMVMWMHIPVPKKCLSDTREMERFVQQSAANVELAITTMGPLGKARITKLPLHNLRPENRRLGLVNYVRDASRENAKRRWYNFRAVSQFRIENGLLYNQQTKEPWLWYKIQEALRNKPGQTANKPYQLKQNTSVKK